MVNSPERGRDPSLVTGLITTYVGVVVATIVALVLLTTTAPDQATGEAWGHAVAVTPFAALLLLRWRAAERGNDRARTATGIIAVILAAVNVVEALVPGFLPTWMQVEMCAIAALMTAIAFLVLGKRR